MNCSLCFLKVNIKILKVFERLPKLPFQHSRYAQRIFTFLSFSLINQFFLASQKFSIIFLSFPLGCIFPWLFLQVLIWNGARLLIAASGIFWMNSTFNEFNLRFLYQSLFFVPSLFSLYQFCIYMLFFTTKEPSFTILSTFSLLFTEILNQPGIHVPRLPSIGNWGLSVFILERSQVGNFSKLRFWLKINSEE